MTHPTILLTAAALFVVFSAALSARAAQVDAAAPPFEADSSGGRIRSPYGPGRIAYFIDTRGIIRLVVEGMPDNRKVIADIERILK